MPGLIRARSSHHGSRRVARWESATTRGLAADGAAVAINCSTSAKEAETVEERIRVGGGKAKALMADMSDRARWVTGQVLVTAGGINP